MKLIFLSNDFPNPFDATRGTFNSDLAGALSAEHEVTVVSPISWLDELRARRSKLATRIPRARRIGNMSVYHPRYYYTPGFLRQYYGTFLWWSLRECVTRLTRDSKPDCVISYWAHPDGEAAVRLARSFGVPSIAMVGGSDVLLLTRNHRRRRCIQNVLQRADAVLAVSNDLRTKVAGLGIPQGKIHVLRRGVDTAQFSPGDSDESRRHLGLRNQENILLFVGRMVQVKGLDTLLDACDRLHQQNRDFLLCLIGDGPLRRQLAADVDRRGLSPHVRFVGRVPHDELVHWYRAADLTVLSSRSEGIPNVLLESLACGTPFVATSVGGVPEIARHDAARLVPPDSPEQLATAIDTLLNERPEVPSCQRPDGLHGFANAVVELIHRVQTQSRTKRPGLMYAQQPPGSSGRLRLGRSVLPSVPCLRQVRQADGTASFCGRPKDG